MNIKALCTNCKNHRTGEFSNLGIIEEGEYTRTCRKCKTKWNINVVYDESVQAIAARYIEICQEKYESFVFTEKNSKSFFETYWAIRDLRSGMVVQVATEAEFSISIATKNAERVLRTFNSADRH